MLRVMDLASEEAEALPSLRRWLAGRDRHPLRWFFQAPPSLEVPAGVLYLWWRSPVLAVVDGFISTLERASIPGLEAKRKQFRALPSVSLETVAESDLRSRDKLSELCAELAVAAALVDAGVQFRFNTGRGPDILLPETGKATAALEVGSRSPEGLSSLAMEVLFALQSRNIVADVRLSADSGPPLAIRQIVRLDVAQWIVGEAARGATIEVSRTVAPGCELRIEVRPGEGAEPNVLTTSGIPADSPHGARVAAEVAMRVLRDERKMRQAELLPTVLVVDVTRCDSVSAIRSQPWDAVFSTEWRPEDRFVGVAAMVSHANDERPFLDFSPNPHASAADLVAVETSLGPSGMAVLSTPGWRLAAFGDQTRTPAFEHQFNRHGK
jgi:hypothetical protein